MNRYSNGIQSTQSKATSQTLCQKCLKRDNYECKATAQERPYIARPSRTQQLANPKLVPKLTSDVPNELLRKTGVADEQLAKRGKERGRKRKADDVERVNDPRKRSRSTSPYDSDSDSVSTVSTNLSRNSSPRRAAEDHTGNSQLLSNLQMNAKRRRNRSTSISSTSESPKDRKRRGWSRDSEPHAQRKYRRDHNENFSREKREDRKRRRRRDSRSHSLSYPSDTSSHGEHRKSSYSDNRSKRRRHSSKSPIDRGRDRDSHNTKFCGRTRSRSGSRDRSQVIRNRKSMTPGRMPELDDVHDRRHRPSSPSRHDGYSQDNERYGGSARSRKEDNVRFQQPPHPLHARKDRSLSPFSKRLALTQAMNMGR